MNVKRSVVRDAFEGSYREIKESLLQEELVGRFVAAMHVLEEEERYVFSPQNRSELRARRDATSLCYTHCAYWGFDLISVYVNRGELVGALS